MPIHWLTILLLGIVALFTWRAYRAGFIRELVSLAAVILAIPIAGLFYDDLHPKVEPLIGSSVLAALISFGALLVGVIIAGQVVAHLLRKGATMLNLGIADRFAGGAFGLVKGLLVCQIILIALVAFPRPDLREHIDDSRAARTMLDGSHFVLALLPGTFGDSVSEFLEARYPGSGAAAGAPGAPAIIVRVDHSS